MQVGKKLLRELLGSDGTRYEIPLYQRTYDWDTQQFAKLWSDLLSLAKSRVENHGSEHFLGTLVLDSGHRMPGDFTFLVVDGQQRLTTLTMLLAALRDLLRERRPELSDADELQDAVLVHRYKKTAPDRFRLWPTQGDRATYVQVIEGEADLTLESNLVGAYRYFRTQILRAVSERGEAFLDQLKFATLDGLRFVTITAEENDNVYTIFESLNNTGLKLTQGDLLRNFFFSRLGEFSESVYASFWFPMQERLSRDDLAHLFWLDLTWSDTEAKKDDTFKKQAERTKDFSSGQLRDEIRRYNQLSVLLEAMRLPSKETDPGVRRSLQRLADYGIESIDPLVLGLLSLRHAGRISSSELVDAMAVLESFLIRRLLVRAPHNALSRILMRAYGYIDPASPADSLREYLSKDNKDFATDEEVRRAVVSVNFYRSGTTKQRKTLLGWLEEELAGNEPAGLTKATIEHVLPQNLTNEWRDHLLADLGDFSSAEAVYEAYVHTLANLTLSGYNSKLSDRPFEQKRELLIEKSNIELNKWIASRSTWTRTDILQRGEALSQLVVTTWPGPVLQDAQSAPTPSVDLVENALSQVPAGFWVSVGDFAELVETTIQTVERILTSAEIAGAGRVLDAGGGVLQPTHQRLDQREALENEGVQFDSSGRALQSHRWVPPIGERVGSVVDVSMHKVPTDPLREFLDVAASRLTPGLSESLRALLSRWTVGGNRVLLGVEEEGSEFVTAVLADDSGEQDPVAEINLSSSSGLWVRLRNGERQQISSSSELKAFFETIVPR